MDRYYANAYMAERLDKAAATRLRIARRMGTIARLWSRLLELVGQKAGPVASISTPGAARLHEYGGASCCAA